MASNSRFRLQLNFLKMIRLSPQHLTPIFRHQIHPCYLITSPRRRMFLTPSFSSPDMANSFSVDSSVVLSVLADFWLGLIEIFDKLLDILVTSRQVQRAN